MKDFAHVAMIGTVPNAFFVSMKNSAEAEADAIGVSLTVAAGKEDGDTQSQIDAVDADERRKKAAALKRAAGRPPLLLSSVTGEGVEPVLRALAFEIEGSRDEAAPDGSGQSGGAFP